MDGICKFDELRRKTDRELVYFLKKDVEIGFAACASISLSANGGVVGAAYARAKRASLDGARLLWMLREASVADRACLEMQLRHLERIVNRLGRELFEKRDANGAESAALFACAH